jgi:hypothetical protein
MRITSRPIRLLAASALAVAGVALTAQPAQASSSSSSLRVTSDADSGPGSFRAAVEAANLDQAIDTISFEQGLHVELLDEVVFTGQQDLTIAGRNSTISGAAAAPDTDTWDSGLFVATGGGDLEIGRLTFEDSFNNGIAVFLPAGSGDVEIDLTRVIVRGAQFHGVLIDGQSTTGYNTDDVVHFACSDPYPVDSGSSIRLDVVRTEITGAGQLAGGYDISLLTGCPQDFDGLRVDQGAEGDITGSIVRSSFDENLADGVELDEKGDGGVDVVVARTSFVSNGATVEIECTAEYLASPEYLAAADPEACDAGDFLADLDDGFDIDEEDAGDLVADVSRVSADANSDEGLDFDEAGEGDIVVTVRRVDAIGNTDEAFKASEEDGGDVIVNIARSTFDTVDNDGVQVEEEGAGSVDVVIVRTTVTGRDGDGVRIDEADAGDLRVDVARSSFVGSPDAGLRFEQADDGSGSVTIRRSDLSGNGGGALDDRGGVDSVDISRTIGV